MSKCLINLLSTVPQIFLGSEAMPPFFHYYSDVRIYQSTRRRVPENWNLHQHQCQKLGSQMFYLSLYLLHWFRCRVLWWYVCTYYHNTRQLLLLYNNFLTGIAYFYCCTMHFDSCIVQSPTNALFI